MKFLFLAFYAVIDVLGFVKWSFPLKVIGMNSIAIYVAQVVIDGWKANDADGLNCTALPWRTTGDSHAWYKYTDATH